MVVDYMVLEARVLTELAYAEELLLGVDALALANVGLCNDRVATFLSRGEENVDPAVSAPLVVDCSLFSELHD